MKWPKNWILISKQWFCQWRKRFITICLNDIFPSMCDTRLTSDTISLLINVKFFSIEELNVLSYIFLQDFYPCLSVKFVTDGQTVGRIRFTCCGGLASWIFFKGVSILITFGWVLSPPYTHNIIVNNIESIKLQVTFLATNCKKNWSIFSSLVLRKS